MTKGDKSKPGFDLDPEAVIDSERRKKKRITEDDKRAMLDYVEAGLKVGRRRDDLLADLASFSGRDTRQVERYIADQRQKDDHQDAMRLLLRDWIGQIKWPEPDGLPEGWGDPGKRCIGDFCWESKGELLDPLIFCAVELDSLFASLQEHLSGDDLWPLYEQFKKTGGEYWCASSDYVLRKLEMAEGEWEGHYSYTRELERVHTKIGELTDLKVRIVARLRELLELKTVPGTCHSCRPRQ